MGLCVALVVVACGVDEGGDVEPTSTSMAVTTTSVEPSSSTTAAPVTTTTVAATTSATTLASTTTTLPAVADVWAFASGDVLVASPDGVILVRSLEGEWVTEARLVGESALRAFPDGEGGIVYQSGIPYWAAQEHAFGPIVQISEPGTEPRVLAELWESDSPYEEYEPLRLLTVAEIKGDRTVLFLRDRVEDERYLSTLYGYSLTSGTTAEVALAGVDEVGLVCIAWAGDEVAQTIDGEGNASIGRPDRDGMWLDAEIGEVLYGPQEFDAGSSACVASYDEDAVVLAYQSMYYGCGEDPGFRVGIFEARTWEPVAAVHHIAVPEEVCGIQTLQTAETTAVITFGAGEGYVIDLETGDYSSLPTTGAASIVP